MDILDIILAKSMTPQGQIDTYAAKAQKAVTDAKQAVDNIESITEQTNTNNENAQIALENAQAAAATFEDIDATIDAKVQAAVSATEPEGVSAVDVIDSDTSAAKIKKLRARKKGVQQAYDVMKNYTSTGNNEDGSMTQKAITQALQNQKTELETKIKNIPSGGGSGSGNISGNISAEDEGSIVTIDENGNIIPSSITEADVILTQIISGTYKNDNIVGLEIDYANKTFSRLQGAKGLTAGTAFNKFTMFGGRKRCIVDAQGNIIRFLTSEDTAETVADQRIMVYQPSFYYLRVPLSTTKTTNGIKVNKEHLYLSDKKSAGFMLHPIFRDEDGNALRYVLLPAFEGSAYRYSSNTFVYDDAQNIDFEHDCLVSTINAKPISGTTQEFTAANAKKMAENNGTGWKMTDLKFVSMNQMLMMVEYGSPNIQNTFNKGLTEASNLANINLGFNTGSTLSLLNSSGQALSSLTIRNGVETTYSEEGKCSISYRGIENPYGNMWKMIDGLTIINHTANYNGTDISFKITNADGWINAFGYDNDFDWIYLPIEVSSNANSNLPVGDYTYQNSNQNEQTVGMIGGFSSSTTNSGLFYYSLETTTNFHSRHDSARVMFIPTTNTMIDNHNYNTWYNSL